MTSDENIQLESRKAEHIKLTLNQDVGVSSASNGFEHFEIIPNSIPDVNYHDISMKTKFLGREFDAPVLVAGMTGGYPEAEKINTSLARICSKLNIPLGLGSQRAMIVNPETTTTYNVKKDVSDVFLIGNLGLVQFSLDFTTDDLLSAAEKVEADAMAIHINAFQEICQPEGDVNFSGAWNELEKIVKASKVPIIGKEVGSGIPYEEVVRMEQLGLAAVDVGGSGGTSWAKIELMRHEGDNPPYTLDDATLNWGIPTAFATYEATAHSNLPIISTGGMYHGMMAAKALMMGTTMVGIARPVLKQLINHGEDAAEQWLVQYIDSIKRLMFMLGAKNIDSLRSMKNRLVPRERARDWLSFRKLI